MTGRILILGASGKTGAAIAHNLHGEGAKLRLASRSGASLSGAETVFFDWTDPTTFGAAVADVERLYLLSPIGDNAPLNVVAPFIDQALAAGVRRFVLLSSTLIAEGGPATGRIHAYLRQTAPEWTVLRPSWFMQNFIHEPHRSTICNEDAIYSATGDGLVPFVAVEDIAAVGAQVLLADEASEHELLITGPELLTYDSLARTIGEARGRGVRHIHLSVEALVDRHMAFGMPRDFAEMLANLDGVIAQGGEARLSDVVPRLTKRPGVRFRHFAMAHTSSWGA